MCASLAINSYYSSSSNFGSSSVLAPTHDETDMDDDDILNDTSQPEEPKSPNGPSFGGTSSADGSSGTSSNGSSACPSPAAAITTKTTPTVKALPNSRKRKAKQDEVDELLVRILYSLQESKTAKTETDEEEHYGQQIAHTLRRFNPRQKALAKMRVQEVLFNIEFNSEPIPSPATQSMNYSTPNHYYQNNQDY